ncbi:MAG TPA: ATP-binding cassette domain-containing protein [Bacteroidetes bacterium]|nr:ATP-binding cassette domain-containing protein [Bacteroidota bacterium]
MRIEKIDLKNVGPFAEETIEFQPVPNTEKKAEVHVFTGPNGSGKSTLLYALAAAFTPDSQIGDMLKRFHDIKDSFIKVNCNGDTYSLLGTNFQSDRDGIQHVGHLGFGLYKSLVLAASQSKDISPSLDYACFAYSGNRNISHTKVETIKEINTNPLHESLVFNKTIKNQVNQWLANMIAKEAIANQNNKTEAAKGYRQNIASLENVISELMKEDVRFELETEPADIVLRKNGTALDFDVLPDGLKSIISWLGDLLMRLDRLPWENNTPILQRNILLFLDEIEIHLHPKWQMKILPIMQKLLPNAQIFISTHSPFVVNSVDGAWIYKLVLDEHGVSTCKPPVLSETGKSYSYILDEIFDVEERFGLETEQQLDDFYKMRDDIFAGKTIDKKEFTTLVNKLLKEGIEVQQIIGHELRQIKRITQKEFSYDEN